MHRPEAGSNRLGFATYIAPFCERARTENFAQKRNCFQNDDRENLTIDVKVGRINERNLESVSFLLCRCD